MTDAWFLKHPNNFLRVIVSKMLKVKINVWSDDDFVINQPVALVNT